MSASPLLDVDAFDRFLAQQIHELQRPRVGPLTADEREALSERFGDLAPRVAQLLEIDLWEQNADVRALNEASYGYALQHKSRERFLKHFVPEGAGARGVDGVRASTDGELLALAASIGALPEADSSRTASEGRNDSARLPRALGSATGAGRTEDEHR